MGPTPPLLTWKVAQKKLPWGIVFLLGGGFALAKGSDVSSSGPNVEGEMGQKPTHIKIRILLSVEMDVC